MGKRADHLEGQGALGQVSDELQQLAQFFAHSEQEPVEVVSLEADTAEGLPLASMQEAHLDIGRERRRGIPEVILAERKTDAQVLSIARAFLRRNGRALISRLRPDLFGRLSVEFDGCELVLREAARAAAIYQRGSLPQPTGGRVGILSAGTSDIPVAEEARLLAEAMGCQIEAMYDVGVAGLHRLLGPLQSMLKNGVDVIIVAAGMDGALPSVVSGLVDVPVIGLPTSVGYGLGGKGVGALLAMLQTCAPGLTVVNIDNGVGAGATAALIANRVAQARRASGQGVG